MYYSGIDLHKDNCYITTRSEEGEVVSQIRLQNNETQLINYFKFLQGEHKVVIETTNNWYWINDLLESNGIEVILAHAKYLKAIAYSKVKTDKIDSDTLSKLLQNGLISPAHKVKEEIRGMRDTFRMRLRLVQKRTSCYNSIHRIADKFNLDTEINLDGETIPEGLPVEYKVQIKILYEQISLLTRQIQEIEKALDKKLKENEDIKRIRIVPGIGKISALTIYLEIDGIERFATEKRFFSYCRLVPGAKNSNKKIGQTSGNKEGNKYLKIAFSDAAVHSIRYYPEIRAHYQKIMRKSNNAIARTVVAKELAKAVYHILQDKTDFKGYKGKPLNKMKSL